MDTGRYPKLRKLIIDDLIYPRNDENLLKNDIEGTNLTGQFGRIRCIYFYIMYLEIYI